MSIFLTIFKNQCFLNIFYIFSLENLFSVFISIYSFISTLVLITYLEKLIFKIWPLSQIFIFFTKKTRFGLSFGSGMSELDKNRHKHVTLPHKQACKCVFWNFTKLTLRVEVKCKNLTKFDPEITFRTLTRNTYLGSTRNRIQICMVAIQNFMHRHFCDSKIQNGRQIQDGRHFYQKCR